MDIQSVCLIGGTGFLGSAVAEQACGKLLRVRVVTRSRPRGQRLLVLPTVETMVADPRDEKSLAAAFDNMDAVVNLAGILHESGRSTFDAIHVDLPRKIVAACRYAGVRHLVHVSALGASESAPSEYLRSKARGEAALRAGAAGLPVTIFRPSVIFGEHDRFLNVFAKLVRLLPVLPLAGAHARFQPVWVEDAARCIAACLGDPRSYGETYELGGPREYTLEQMVRWVAACIGRKARIVPLPGPAGSLQAFALEHLPGKLMSRDNLRSMEVASVCGGPFPALFGFQPSALEAVAPEYLLGTGARARYQSFRNLAGR